MLVPPHPPDSNQGGAFTSSIGQNNIFYEKWVTFPFISKSTFKLEMKLYCPIFSLNLMNGGGLFHSIMRGDSEPLFSNNWIMTQTPNVMRPFKELWTKATNEHYCLTLSNWQFELLVPVDTYLYMTSNPPFPIKDHYKVRMAFPLKDDSRIADIRAFLEYQAKTKWVKLW